MTASVSVVLPVGRSTSLPWPEGRTGTDEGDEVGRVHGPPPGLRGLDELERHRQTGRPGAGAPGDLAPVPDGRETSTSGETATP